MRFNGKPVTVHCVLFKSVQYYTSFIYTQAILFLYHAMSWSVPTQGNSLLSFILKITVTHIEADAFSE